VDHHILGRGLRCLVLQKNGDTVGLLTLHQIKDVPRDEWRTITAAQVMLNLDQIKHIRPDAQLTSALEVMDREGVNQLPVFEDGQLQGILTREDLITYLRTLQELAA
jgi:CBS domain-containing protein